MRKTTQLLEKGPIFIVVSGAPGSGKSTLAKLLSEKLRLLHIERDVLLEQIYQQEKNDPNYNVERVGIPRAYAVVVTLLQQKISVIMDATLYKNKSEVDIKSLATDAKLLNIHCIASDCEFVKNRFRNREIRLNDGKVPDWLDDHMKTLDKIYPDVVNLLDLECPQLTVRTDDEYDPKIDQIIDWVMSNIK